jgi:phytoene dehydrogenase-like protein
MKAGSGIDVLIVGGGVGGLLVGALLAQKEGARVLIVEREDRVGGRLIHFQGENIHKPDDYLIPMARRTGWLARSEPALPTMIGQGLLRGYSFEAGWHGLLGGARSRICHILEALGEPVEIVPYGGFAYWDEGKLHSVIGRGPFPWMSEEDFNEMHRIAGEIYRMSPDQARTYNHVSLMDWLKQRTENEKVIEFFDITGAFLVGLNSASEVSAGEYILTTRYVTSAGLHLASGSVGTAGEPGLVQIAYNLSDIIASNGGEIRLNQKVKRILVEDDRAVGVMVEGKEGDEEIRAPKIVCNVPVQVAVNSRLIPVEHLPEGFVEKAKNLVSVGGVCPMFGLSREILEVPGMHMTRIYPDSDAFPGGIVFGYISHSLLVEGRAPEGKQLIEVWMGFSTQELRSLRETGKVDMLCDVTMDFMKENHPGFEASLEWALFPVIDFVLSVAPTPEQVWERMPAPICPGIEGLYFVGDAVRNYAQYTEGVAHGALLCAGSITGKDYLQLVPEYQR